jgi:hypothetical protein
MRAVRGKTATRKALCELHIHITIKAVIYQYSSRIFTQPAADFVSLKQFVGTCMLLTCFRHLSRCRCVLLRSFDSPWLTLLISESTKYEDETQNI